LFTQLFAFADKPFYIISMKNITVYLAALGFTMMWSLTFIWYKKVLLYYEPLSVAILRLAVSSLLLVVILLAVRQFSLIKKKDVGIFLLLATFQPFGYFLGETFGIREVTSTFAAVVISTIPLFTPIAARIFLKEQISKFAIFGIIISFGGILLMVMKDDFSLDASVVGLLLMFLAVFSAVGYSIVLRKLSNNYKPLVIVAWQNFIGVFYFLPLFLFFDFSGFITIIPNYELVENMLLLAVFGSTFAFVLFTYVIARIGPTRTSVFGNAIPVFTAIFSYFLLKDEMTLKTGLGILVVFTGVMLTQYRAKNKQVS